MSDCTAEFLIEPFTEGDPGQHVKVGIAAMEAAGLSVAVGPFGNTVAGPVEEVVPAVARMLSDALDAGASRISVQVSTE